MNKKIEIGKKFNQLTMEEYLFYIDNHKKYSDFNTLGLYRSILENEKLSLTEKIEVRNYSHQFFKKTFDFLQIKDPFTFVRVLSIGQNLTVADEHQIWKDVIRNQENILKEKRIKHRNFGVYSKHNCGYENCPYNGLMIQKDSFLQEDFMHFKSDSRAKYPAKQKSDRIKKERKTKNQRIDRLLEDEY